MTPADRVLAAYAIRAARESERLIAAEALRKAVAEYRAANPAPTGKYWDEERGKMVLCELPAGCTVTYVDGSPCGTRAVEWDDEGDAWCEMHGGSMSVEAKTLQIIPAPPGWRVVRFDILNGDEIHARERPVLCLALVEREVDGEIERTVEPLAQDEFGDGAIYASTYRPIMAAPGVSLDEFFEMAVEEARRVQRLRANGKPMYVQQGDTLRKVDTPDLPRSSPPSAD